MASGHGAYKSHTAAIPTSLYFQIDKKTQLSSKVFLQYLEHCLKLDKRKVFVKLCSFSVDEKREFVEANVQFPSVNKAKKSRKTFCKANTAITVSFLGFKTDKILQQIDRSKRTNEYKQKMYIQQHEEKIEVVKMKLENMKSKKKVDLAVFEKRMQEKDALNARKVELKNQLREFRQYSQKLQDGLEHLKEIVYTSRRPIKPQFLSIQTDFARECKRFQNSLPIYARRLEIIERIKASQVSIVIGETGSGKSTQLVQYLYDAGFAEHKLIACTQPRKVAATSLADYVSNEMCFSQNTLVACKVSTSHEVKKLTKILYLTDHALLDECIQDRTFSKYSCLIIDEAHERNLHTDILLAFIKQCLPLRKDMKVIITSATIDPQLFVDYFDGYQCPVIMVSGRAFPVDVAWHPLKKDIASLRYPNMPYVEEAVDHVVRIHRSEDLDGAILVFLTSAFEIEVACNMTEHAIDANKAIVLPLHGRLQPVDQKKVFQIYENKRKIVFSTNVAETSITIPDVKFIIDSGFAKEMCFDPKRNMNSLEVRRISKSSAEQRKGRAGRVSAGKCLRLFSSEEFETMPPRSLPEILRVHLTLAVLKLFEFGVKDVLQFDFVEMPSRTSLIAAVDMLKFLGAINETIGGLSETGKHLALFPIDPQLSKVLLDSIVEEVLLEGVVTVAISSLGGNIFFRGQTDEMKEKSDQQKLNFLHHGGDQLTCLNVYKEWVKLNKGDRNKWCVANCINAKSMRLIEDTVKELLQILKTRLNCQPAPTKIPNVELAEAKITKLYFFSFLWNLGIFLGHEKVGYMSPKIAGEQLVMFPGSALVQCNVVPRYLFYEKTLKTTQQYLLQVAAVKDEWIEEAKAIGILSDETLQKVEKYYVKEVVLSNLGAEVLIRGVMRKKKALIENLKTICNNSSLALDCSIERGTASVHCITKHEPQLRAELNQRFSLIKNDLKKENIETGVTKDEDDVKLLLGIGGCIQFVLMPLDFHTVIVKGPVDDTWTERVRTLLLKSGEIVNFSKKTFAKETRVYVKFFSPKEAENALKSDKSSLPDGVSFQPQTIRGRGNEGTRLFRLQIDRNRRERRDFGFVEFDDENDFALDSAHLLHSSVDVPVQFGRLRIVFKEARNPRPNTFQLFMPKVPSSVSQKQLKAAIAMKLGHEKFKIKFGLEKPFVTTEQQMDALSKQLKDTVSKFATPSQFRINFQHPEEYHSTFRSYIDFNDPEEGQNALDNLENESISGKLLEVQLLLSSFTRLTKSIHDVVESDLNDIKKQAAKHVNLKVKHIQGKNSLIELSSGNIDEFVAVKKKINSLLKPKVFECDSEFLQEYILSKQCRDELEVIGNETVTVILQNFRIMSICIYGKRQNTEDAESSLKEKIKELKVKGLKICEINLRGRGMPPGLMRHMARMFGVELLGIFQIKGVRRATIDTRKQVLTLFANDNAISSIQGIIEDYKKSVSLSNALCHSKVKVDAFECCVCLTEIEDTKEIFRPECCGHTYHLDCIKMQLATNAIAIPVLCADCSLPFVCQDFENLMKKKLLSLYQLVECSLKSYLSANKDKVRNCPTPNCGMVYNVSTKKGTRFICSDCSSHICTKCHVQYHDGLSCKMYQAGKDGEDEFHEWLRRKPETRKRCPGCNAPIEKIEGCNKVTCIHCHVHICWVCLEYFGTEQDCYKHLGTVHGTFGDN